ncbi:hypothetical protein FH972_022755 [Carpinus fangiana]|uniref:3-oxo-5-alpha-steroid 4-dehydrogenase C-terminal domain-containing protein n=1 Tax=Carpinus fangiana TaxID=176857 RepID=A0A5N6KTN6_9ROSI|nr:hypothetical protein FH972_022755 [Carpinus fangiana]
MHRKNGHKYGGAVRRGKAAMLRAWMSKILDVLDMAAPSLLLRLFYVSAASGPLRERFIDYGSREAAPAPKAENGYEAQRKRIGGTAGALLDSVAAVRVPHAWFNHFYVLSLLVSCFWASQILSDGSFFEWLATREVVARSASMSLDQAMLAWAMMTFQAGRRLYECLDNHKPSASKMWVGHWAAGLAFYAAMGVAVWIEASLRSLHIDPPSLRTFVGLPIFVLASGIQHDVHDHLASMKKYSLPKHPMFATCICPHYLAECFIYLSLAIVAAPQGHILNWTIVSGLMFVGINLGVTAKGTRLWYARKFNDERIMLKACMIPGIF